ncbi:hypothetical protein GIB67_041408 [Kingdonia uniflora]|uniref:Glutathione synthase substrate-binding domain-containing protein n=1 Tax=Kingdonia uniflora TaxID=39325 RepID=A0A7J7LRD6_9MAGN|nr:hypothetical protein GIB67_041408 [Kingdonia uniflora]
MSQFPLSSTTPSLLPRKCGEDEVREPRDRIFTTPQSSIHDLDPELLQKMVYDALVWSSLHGLVVGDKSVQKSGSVPGVGLVHAPFALLPMSFPQSHWQQACKLAPIFNELVDRVSLDGKFLQDSLSRTKKVDAFTSRLLDIHSKMLELNKKEEIRLGLHRSDYMLDDHTKDLLQIELNTISSSFPGLSCLVSELHRNLLDHYGEHIGLDSKRIPGNTSVSRFAEALVQAWREYNNSRAVVMFVVQTKEQNMYDQHWLSTILKEKYPFILTKCSGGQAVSVVYFRAGYAPSDYPSDSVVGPGTSSRCVVHLFQEGRLPSRGKESTGLHTEVQREVLSDITAKNGDLAENPAVFGWEEDAVRKGGEETFRKYVCSPAHGQHVINTKQIQVVPPKPKPPGPSFKARDQHVPGLTHGSHLINKVQPKVHASNQASISTIQAQQPVSSLFAFSRRTVGVLTKQPTAVATPTTHWTNLTSITGLNQAWSRPYYSGMGMNSLRPPPQLLHVPGTVTRSSPASEGIVTRYRPPLLGSGTLGYLWNNPLLSSAHLFLTIWPALRRSNKSSQNPTYLRVFACHVSRFLENKDDIAQLRKSFAGLWSLDDSTVINVAIERPELFVLKPQREGGGNNIYGQNVSETLLKLQKEGSEEFAAYILMQRIFPTVSPAFLVREGICHQDHVISELGIYGAYLRNREKVIINEQSGYLMRTKVSSSNEGGVAAGFAVLDSVYLN